MSTLPKTTLAFFWRPSGMSFLKACKKLLSGWTANQTKPSQ
jgi:hypothetical protein